MEQHRVRTRRRLKCAQTLSDEYIRQVLAGCQIRSVEVSLSNLLVHVRLAPHISLIGIRSNYAFPTARCNPHASLSRPQGLPLSVAILSIVAALLELPSRRTMHSVRCRLSTHLPKTCLSSTTYPPSIVLFLAHPLTC